MFRFALIGILATTLISGCAELMPVPEAQCREANASSWESVGHADGQDGLESGPRLEALRRSCAAVRIAPNSDAYLTGWNRGVLEHCTPERGYTRAVNGMRINEKLCPEAARGRLLANAKLGRTVHNLKAEIAGAKADMLRFEHELKDRLIPRDTRRDLIDRIRFLSEKLETLEPQLTEAQASAPVH